MAKRAPSEAQKDTARVWQQRSTRAAILEAARRLAARNGAAELIWLTALAFIRPQSRVLVLAPTFCEYARAAELKFSRDTEYRGEVGAHPQDPQLKPPLAANVA